MFVIINTKSVWCKICVSVCDVSPYKISWSITDRRHER